MHTGSKLIATPRERLVEMETRFPILEIATRPAFFAAVACFLFFTVISYIAWTAGSAIHDLWSGYTQWLENAAQSPQTW